MPRTDAIQPYETNGNRQQTVRSARERQNTSRNRKWDKNKQEEADNNPRIELGLPSYSEIEDDILDKTPATSEVQKTEKAADTAAH